MALLSGLAPASRPAPGDGPIKESDTQGFMADVIEASRDVPVIVDFWAPWCGPCKQLGPILERVVKGAGGKVRMVRINIDENQELAAQLRIQSIPTVYGFKNGQPVDGFAGALPESQVKAFVERLTGPLGPAPTELGIEEARRQAEAGQLERAAQIYRQVLEEDAGNPEALAGLARCHLGRGHYDDARQVLDRVPAEHANHVEVDGARAALTLAETAGELPAPATLSARLQADANDHQARLDLATGLFLRGQIEAAMDHLLTIVRSDREWSDQAARKQLVKFFEALGPQHPATIAGRRKLSAVLFS